MGPEMEQVTLRSIGDGTYVDMVEDVLGELQARLIAFIRINSVGALGARAKLTAEIAMQVDKEDPDVIRITASVKGVAPSHPKIAEVVVQDVREDRLFRRPGLAGDEHPSQRTLGFAKPAGVREAARKNDENDEKEK